MTIEKFADIFRANGFTVDVEPSHLLMTLGNITARVSRDDEWNGYVGSFFKAKQFSFDEENRILTSYRAVEFQVVRLDLGYFPRPDFELADTKKNTFRLNQATPDFVLSLLAATSGSKLVDVIKRRIERRSEGGRLDKDGNVKLRFDDLLYIPYTARYCVSRKIAEKDLISIGRARVKACLFKMAYSGMECWELRESIRARNSRPHLPETSPDSNIPQATYIDDLVSYYKVAKSSQFPDQEYLSYYHILEYYFLRVADEIIHTNLKAQINSPSFSASYENINKILATIKRSDNTSDETEMLKAVLNKFVPEEDLIEFILAIEKAADDKIYSDTKREVFGEKATIRLEKGHALSNTARVIKQIRNALVHSSDRYNREQCFMPFSESEAIVSQYVPLVKFLAEKVIFSTAS